MCLILLRQSFTGRCKKLANYQAGAKEIATHNIHKGADGAVMIEIIMEVTTGDIVIIEETTATERRSLELMMEVDSEVKGRD